MRRIPECFRPMASTIFDVAKVPVAIAHLPECEAFQEPWKKAIEDLPVMQTNRIYGFTGINAQVTAAL